MGEAMALWFVQRKGWVDYDHQNDWYTVKGPFHDDSRAEAWIDKQTHLTWVPRDEYRVVRASLPFEVAS